MDAKAECYEGAYLDCKYAAAALFDQLSAEWPWLLL